MSVQVRPPAKPHDRGSWPSRRTRKIASLRHGAHPRTVVVPGRLVDQTGQTRIFVSAGPQSGTDRKGRAAMIRRVSGLPDRLIEGVQAFDAFSLVTVPFEAAKRIIRESRGSSGIPRMRVAKEDGGGEGSYRARPTPPRAGYRSRSKGKRKQTLAEGAAAGAQLVKGRRATGPLLYPSSGNPAWFCVSRLLVLFIKARSAQRTQIP